MTRHIPGLIGYAYVVHICGDHQRSTSGARQHEHPFMPVILHRDRDKRVHCSDRKHRYTRGTWARENGSRSEGPRSKWNNPLLCLQACELACVSSFVSSCIRRVHCLPSFSRFSLDREWGGPANPLGRRERPSFCCERNCD